MDFLKTFPISTRKYALENNLRHYFTGKPCKRGHVSHRYTQGGNCAICLYAYTHEWSKRNPDKVRAAHLAWWNANVERSRNSRSEWNKSNPERRRAHKADRRARESGTSVNLTNDEREKIIEIYRQRDLMTKITGIQYHVDHIVSVAKGGKHHPDNLQLLTATDNLKKGCK